VHATRLAGAADGDTAHAGGPPPVERRTSTAMGRGDLDRIVEALLLV